MDNNTSKLQELTEKLYNEGLLKGQKEAVELKAQAAKEASVIVAKATAEAEKILADARKKAAELTSKTETDLKMASQQTVSALKSQVENMVITKTVTNPVKEAMSSTDFIKEIITTIAKAFDASDPDSKGLEVILPESLREKMQGFFSSEAAKSLAGGLDASYVKGLADGFKIGPKEGGYLISFTADDFSSMIGEYLRPATRKVLFGE